MENKVSNTIYLIFIKIFIIVITMIYKNNVQQQSVKNKKISYSLYDTITKFKKYL